MIDFIKCLNIEVGIPILLNNKYLEFNAVVSERTGEINEQRYKAEHKNLKFEIVGNRYVNMSGSIHKYMNDGQHNCDDFTYSGLVNVIMSLYEKFNLNPHTTPINSMEFGVNVIVPFVPKDFIKRRIIAYKGNAPSVSRFNGKGYMKKFIHNQYIIKIYDKRLDCKRLHYETTDNILRFEIKVMRMQYIKDVGIKTMYDLLDIAKLRELGKRLLKVFNDILIVDEVDLSHLTNRERSIYPNGTNPMYWENLKPIQGENYKSHHRKYYRELNKFKNLIAKYDLDRTQKEVSKLIENKLSELLKPDVKSGYKFTAFLDEVEKLNWVRSNYLNTASERTPQERRCKVTGLDISMQREKSEFLCTTGVRYYMKHHPEIYRELEKRLSKKWDNESLEKRIEEIHHSIRNEYFNKKHNTRRAIKKINMYPSLFDNLMLIRDDKLRLAGYEAVI